jgi:thymidylate synthase (FAD)
MLKIAEPRAYLVGRQEVDADEIGRFLEDEGVAGWETDTEVGGERLVEVAGRLCYMSFAKPRPGGNAAYVGRLLEVGHGSVLEHAVFSLILTGVSRSLTHELVRHRAGFGYSQLSQRYVDHSDVRFVMPPAFAGDATLTAAFRDSCDRALTRYAELALLLEATLADVPDRTLRRKMAREAARSVLPNCVETKIFVTGNARAWRHFLEMRGSEHADAEIRRLAWLVLGVLRRAAPNLFGDYAIDPESGAISTEHRTV